MGIDSSWILQLALVAGAALVAFGFVLGRRPPPEYGPDEIVRGPDNSTVTTIARNDLIATCFFENGRRVAKAKYWGHGDKGIVLSLEGDEREYLVTNDGDWFEETRFNIKPDISLMLLVNGAPLATAERLPGRCQGKANQSAETHDR